MAAISQALQYRPNGLSSSGVDAKAGIAQMQQFFGPLRNSDVETIAADRFAHETHNLPKAYEGRNKFLMATIDFLITKDDDWYTRVILPWEFTEELHVAWNIWRFNKTMMDYEPHQGVPRYVSQESESHSVHDSQGLAFISSNLPNRARPATLPDDYKSLRQCTKLFTTASFMLAWC